MSEPKFGDKLRGIWASETNPIRDGYYVRTINRTGNFNPGKFYELTDKRGKFWSFWAKDTIPLPDSDADEISRLRTQVSTLQARVDAGDRLRESCKHIKRQLDVVLPNAVFPVFEESLKSYDALKTAASKSEVEK